MAGLERMSRITATLASCLFLALPTAVNADDAGKFWPQWRGPLGTGVAPDADPPVHWGEDTNIRWKTPLPGHGHSTPIVWGDRIYLTAAVPYGDAVTPAPDLAPGAHDNLPVTRRRRFVVLAVDRSDGKILWQRSVHDELPHEGGHVTGSLASNSPVTDGEHVYAFFGSRGLYCLDRDGNLKWRKDLGRMQTLHGHGEGSSPALYGETLIVNFDHEGDSFLLAFDKNTAQPLWRVPRDEPTSWSTPLIVEHGGRTQVVVSATKRVRGYDLATGDLIWSCGGLSRNVVASPVALNGMVIATSSYDHQAMLAIRLEGAEGDVTNTGQVAWKLDRRTPYVPSPLLYGDALYFLSHYQNVMTCLDATSGRTRHGPFRLSGVRDIFASPVGAAGRVYVTDRSGMTLVFRHGNRLDVLARNRLSGSFSASAAIAGRELFLRGAQHLYCLAED